MTGMHLEDLPRALELQQQLKQWQEAHGRCDHGMFKGASMRVFTAAHGHQGQSAETVINLDAAQLKPFCEDNIARVQAELREIGVEI